MMGAIPALLLAFLIDILFGDPPNRFHPVVAMGSYIGWLTRRWNHGRNRQRFLAGSTGILLGGILFALPWILFIQLQNHIPLWMSVIITGIMLKAVFAFRTLLQAGSEVQQALMKNDLCEARRLLSWHLVSRDTGSLNPEQIASATIESLAENLTDSFLAPLFYFSIGGLPLAWFYRFINTADAMIGYHTDAFEFFGKFAARLDDLLNWLPARLAGVWIVLAAWPCRLDGKAALRVMITQHRRTASPNAGWTMAAAAGALGVTLEKKGQYRLEGGPDLPDAPAIQAALRLIRVSLVISLLVCGGLIFIYGLIF